MPHELTRQIEDHLATFPERRKDVEEMRSEWKEFKTRAFWAMTSFIGAILGIGIWVGTIQTNIGHINELASKASVQAENTDKRLNALEVTNGEIRTKLNSIEATLQEIKVSIRQLSY